MEIDIAEDSICNGSTDRDGLKLRPGETKEEALERVRKYKEYKRIEKLMKFSYPRQRETHMMKKKVLGLDQMHCSVDYLTLKRESLRIDSS